MEIEIPKLKKKIHSTCKNIVCILMNQSEFIVFSHLPCALHWRSSTDFETEEYGFIMSYFWFLALGGRDILRVLHDHMISREANILVSLYLFKICISLANHLL